MVSYILPKEQEEIDRYNRRERIFNILTWFLTALSIVGVVLNVMKNPAGFIFWMFTNAAWAIIDFKMGIPQQGVLFIVYFVLSVWGYVSWVHWFGF